MDLDELTAPERALWEAFPRGEPIDLTVPDDDESLDIPTFLRKQAD